MDETNVNPFSLAGKKILITGASSGIGKQCAVRCSSSGATVIITGRDKDRLAETFEMLGPGDHSSFTGDLTDFATAASIAATIASKYGPVDGLLSAAGLEMTMPLHFMKPLDFQNLFNTNVISGFELSRQLIRKNLLSKGSSLVFIASVMGLLGQSGKIGYCSSKGALLSGVKAMALELAPLTIRANCIVPAVCKTPLIEKLFAKIPEEKVKEITAMHPLGLGEPDDVALAAVYLLSGASRWVTGSGLVIDGGYSAQ